jgi:hypothetical protein
MWSKVGWSVGTMQKISNHEESEYRSSWACASLQRTGVNFLFIHPNTSEIVKRYSKIEVSLRIRHTVQDEDDVDSIFHLPTKAH